MRHSHHTSGRAELFHGEAVASQSLWGLAWVVGLTVAAGAATTAQAQTAKEWNDRIASAQERAIEYLIGPLEDGTKTGQMSLKLKLYTFSGEAIEVDAEYKDVSIPKGSTTVRVKGRTYDDIDVVYPPGWFGHEPFMHFDDKKGNRPGPREAGGISALATLALLSAGVDPTRVPKMRKALESVTLTHTAKEMANQPQRPKINQPKKAEPKPEEKEKKEAGPPPIDPYQRLELTPGLRGVYSIGLHASALEAGLSFLERKSKSDPLAVTVRRVLEFDGIQQLQVGHRKDAGYDYKLADPTKTGRWDLSVTQYGILGLWAAARANVELSPAIWLHLNKFLIDIQNQDGGWGYIAQGNDKDRDSRHTMTAAGLASLFVMMDIIHTRTRGSKGPDITPFTNDPLLSRTITSIDRALEQWGRLYKFDVNDSYLTYGIERVGVASGYKYFGDHDWFRRGAGELLKRQADNGSWGANHGGNDRAICGTAWNLMFLVFGGAPILVNKLQHGPKGDMQFWHNYPRDAANLARWYSKEYEQLANWQILDLNPKREDDLHDAPMLYISGHKALVFTDEETDILKRYCERGGTLMFVANGHSREFSNSAIKTLERMYPAEFYPEYRFSALPPEHGLYSDPRSGKQIARLPIWHATNGHRSFAFLIPQDINHAWQTNRFSTNAAFEVVAAIRNYATERAAVLASKFRPTITEGLTRATKRGTLRVAVIKYESVGQLSLQKEPGKQPREMVPTKADWNSAPMTWRTFGVWLEHVAGYGIEETRGVNLTDPDLTNYDALHMTGHYNFKLTPQEQEALVKYVQGGGAILVDATGGVNMEFVQCFRRLMGDLLPGMKIDRVPPNHPVILGTPDGLADVSTMDPSRQLKLVDPNARGGANRLDGLFVNGRLAILMARVDLSVALAGQVNWDRLGFETDGTRKLVANFLMQAKASGKTAPRVAAATPKLSAKPDAQE